MQVASLGAGSLMLARSFPPCFCPNAESTARHSHLAQQGTKANQISANKRKDARGVNSSGRALFQYISRGKWSILEYASGWNKWPTTCTFAKDDVVVQSVGNGTVKST